MLASILGNKGPLPTFTDPDTGKVYQISYLTQAHKVAFENWLTARAKSFIVAMKADLSAEDWDRQMQAFRREVGAGVYGFHSPVAQEAMTTGEGCSHLMAMLMGCTQEEVVDLMVRHGDAVIASLNLAIEQSAAKGSPARSKAGGGEGEEGNASGPTEPPAP